MKQSPLPSINSSAPATAVPNTSHSQWTNRSLSAEEIRSMFGSLAKRYNLLNDVLSLGLHRGWKNALVREIPFNAHHLDLCCGTGDIAARAVRQRGTTTVGLDFSVEMVSEATKNHPEIKFQVGDATALPFEDHSFEAVSISFGIRNIPKLELCLSEINRVLKPGGKLLVLEFGKPSGLFGLAYRVHAKIFLPTIGAVVSGHMFAYDYLQETQSKFPCGGEFEEILKAGMFNSVSSTKFNKGLVYLYRGTKG